LRIPFGSVTSARGLEELIDGIVDRMGVSAARKPELALVVLLVPLLHPNHL